MRRRYVALALATAAILSAATLGSRIEPAAREPLTAPPVASSPFVDQTPLPQPETRLVAAATRVAAFDEERHPHPITPQHRRNFRQVDLLDGAWSALERREFARARALVAEHRRDYPGQWDDMNEGLEILAECMEQRSPEIVERARAFHREQTASMMRKRIRRHCLER